jgi:DNA-binding transcriptional ArsR family regulator
MQTLDITSDVLRQKGFVLQREGDTLVLRFNGLEARSSIYKKDWNRTVEKAVKKFAEDLQQQESIDKLTLQEMKSAMSSNYGVIMNGKAAADAAAVSKVMNHKGPRMLPKAVRAQCSMEQWQLALQEKYRNLKKLTNEKIPGLWLPLEFAISVKSILNIKNITLPFIGIILGPPSSLKSVAVDMPKHARDTFPTDSFSPKAFVSHNSNMTEEQLQEMDMLPKIKNKMFLVSELAPLFTAKDEELSNIFGIIMRVADGNGYWSDSGARGHRGYDGPLMFVWLGAAVDIPYKIHKMLSMLGPKLYFLRLPMSSEDEDDLLRFLQQDDFRIRVQAIKEAFFDYLEYLEACPNMQVDQESGIPKLVWNTTNPAEEQAQRYIIYLGELLAYLRGTVSTWETEDTQGLDYAYASRNVENPKRGMTQLYNLARGHALSQGRHHITVQDDLPLIVKVVLSGAASVERVKVLDLLLSSQDMYKTYDVSEVAEAIGTSKKTAKRTMAEFKALGLVELIELGEEGDPLIQIRLKDGFSWFFSDEFRGLKGDYEPGDFKEFLVKKKHKDLGDNYSDNYTE